MLMPVLAHNWWAFLGRGVLAILFGMLALEMPAAAMLSLALIFGLYVIADGVFTIIAAMRAAGARERWGYLALEGAVGMVAGLAVFAWPHMTVIVFVTLLATWALIKGGLLLGAAFKVDAHHGRWWMALGAVVSVLFGLLLLAAPLTGALLMTWWIGVFAILFGIAMLALAFRLHEEDKHLAAAM